MSDLTLWIMVGLLLLTFAVLALSRLAGPISDTRDEEWEPDDDD